MVSFKRCYTEVSIRYDTTTYVTRKLPHT